MTSSFTKHSQYHPWLPVQPPSFRDLACRYGLYIRDCLRRQVSQELQHTPVHGLTRKGRQSVLHIGLGQSSIDDMQNLVARSTIPSPIRRCSTHTHTQAVLPGSMGSFVAAWHIIFKSQHVVLHVKKFAIERYDTQNTRIRTHTGCYTATHIHTHTGFAQLYTFTHTCAVTHTHRERDTHTHDTVHTHAHSHKQRQAGCAICKLDLFSHTLQVHKQSM